MEIGVLEILGLVAAVYTLSSLRVIKQYERGVSFFLGRYWNTKGPGLKFLPTMLAHMHRVSMRTMAIDIPPQDVITRDNVSVKVNAVLYMRVRDPAAAIIQVENYLYATSQLAQTTLRSVLGEHQMDDLLAEREKINETLRQIIDRRTDPWGIEVTAVEVKDVDLPAEMKRAMAKQAEAERERRAKVINAEGELQASEKLTQAAHIMGAEPVAIQLRYLQTVAEIASEKNSTTFFPFPLDLIRPFLQAYERGGGSAPADARAPAPPLAGGTRAALGTPASEPALPPAREGAERKA
ncbi:MAG: slipin family protein [Gemmatimonadales bacterium]|nr:slipin family protein [Gemmatimonadales bacterium]